jgi:hypothetical protein
MKTRLLILFSIAILFSPLVVTADESCSAWTPWDDGNTRTVTPAPDCPKTGCVDGLTYRSPTGELQVCSEFSVCVKEKCHCAYHVIYFTCGWRCDATENCQKLSPTGQCDDSAALCLAEYCRSNSSIPNVWVSAIPRCCGDDVLETWCSLPGLGEGCFRGRYLSGADSYEDVCVQCSQFQDPVFDTLKTTNKCCGDDIPYNMERNIQFIINVRYLNRDHEFKITKYMDNATGIINLGQVSQLLPADFGQQIAPGSSPSVNDMTFSLSSANTMVVSFTNTPNNVRQTAGTYSSPVYLWMTYAPDDPDESEFFCRGVAANLTGCPLGRFSEADESASYTGTDTKSRAWLAGAENIRVGCCGDDWGDEGYILPITSGGVQLFYLCDNIPGQQKYEWRPTVRPDGFSNAGRIYSIRTEPNNYNQRVFEHKQSDDYDVVVTDIQQWLPCDTDNSLPTEYKLQGDFSSQSFCDGTSGLKCKSIKDSDYICYDSGREEIAECSVLGDVNTGDDAVSKNIGETIPVIFRENWPVGSYMGLVPAPGTGKVLVLLFRNENDFFFAIPKIRDWSKYEYISFDVHFERLDMVDQLNLRLVNSGATAIERKLLDFATVRAAQDYHIIIPLASYSNVTELGFVADSANVGEVRFNNFMLSGGTNKGYYCSKDNSGKGDWRVDFDTDLYADGQACEAASNLFTWTGSRCCGDDYTTLNQGYHSEFYKDIDSNCFDSRPLTADVLEIDGKNPVLGFAGNFYGCFAPLNLLNIKSTVTGELLVNSSNVCEAHGNYFCSNQLLGWSSFGYSLPEAVTAGTQMGSATTSLQRYAGERTELKYSPDNSSAECCHPDDCWNGTDCVGSQLPGDLPYGTLGIPEIGAESEFAGQRCINGEWQKAELKWDWLDMNWGYCPDMSQCLFDTATCYPSGWYSEYKTIAGMSVPALYCQNGDWTSRTKLVAQEMLNIRPDDFVLDCGPAQDVLNFYSQKTSFSQIADRFENVAVAPELNNFCILTYGNSVIIGTSYNPKQDETLASTALNIVLSNAFNVKGFSTAGCEGSLSEDRLHNCGKGIWYNDVKKLIIFDTENKIDLDGNAITNFFSYIMNGIYGLFGIDVPVTAGEKILMFANRTKVFNNLYVSKHGNKMIKAAVERKQTRPGVIANILTATYEGFDTSICSSVRLYAPNAVCNETEGKEVVLAIDRAVGPQEFAELVLDLTRRTRVE